jgi:hypothetical protein
MPSGSELSLVDGSSMDPEMQNSVEECIKASIAKHTNGAEKEKNISADVRNYCNENFGSVWHCVIGKSVALAIGFQEARFVHYTFNWDWHCYLWKTL